MFVLSVKISVTCDRPNLESERISVMPGTPASSVSRGNVTSFSISSGASAGTSVLTWTCTLVMSGTASIGRRAADQSPTSNSPTAAKRTKARCRSEASIILAIICSFSCLSGGSTIESQSGQLLDLLPVFECAYLCGGECIDRIEILLLYFRVSHYPDSAQAIIAIRQYSGLPQLFKRNRLQF